MFTLLMLVALATVASAGTLKREFPGEVFVGPSGRIVGGRDTTIEDAPYQVSIRYWGSHMCGGSIISKDWILTAAHCSVYGFSGYTIRAGSTLRTKGGSDHDVAEIVSHKDFRTSRRGRPTHDIALMRMKQPFEMDATRQPISLFADEENSTIGSLGVVTGWGRLSGSPWASAPERLQIAEVPIISKVNCSVAYASFEGIAEHQICAGYPEGGRDTCQGDSGGPLAIGGRLAGVVSWGKGCALADYPGVFTEVAGYRSWIRNITGV